MLGCRHLVVLLLNGNPQARHGEKHFAPHVLEGVVGSDGEIALLQLNFVGEVSTFFDPVVIPRCFHGIHAVEAGSIGALVAHVIEDEELRFWSEVGRVGQACGGEVIKGLLGQGPGAAGIGLAAAGFLNRADQAEGFVAVEGVNPGGVGIGHHRHVRFVDGFPAANRRTVEGHAFREGGLIEQVVADREVLPLAVKVNELQVDEFDALVLDLTQDVLGGFSHDDQRGGSRSEPALEDRTDPAQPPFVAVVTKTKARVA